MGRHVDYLREPVAHAYAVAAIASTGRAIPLDDLNFFLADDLTRDIADRSNSSQPLFVAYETTLRSLRRDPGTSGRAYALLCACSGITYQTVLADQAWVERMPDPIDGSFDFQGVGRRFFRAAFAAVLVGRLWGQISSRAVERDRDLFQRLSLRVATEEQVALECAALARDLVGVPGIAAPDNLILMQAFDDALARSAGGTLVQRMEAVHTAVRGLIDDLCRRR
ncbi:hypothetical protein [Azospirillum brasilense]|uniref:Uncharacterized protein n=1 Tax=Azospirillum brasilense TaxID=192 RepID=A0A6L3AZ57_AZOBR|nr:hypothetical protein [Azospirillum brasilense]KAA0682072.1 hypothetical protein DS837_20925 [Azospirillum brasilense]